MAEQRSYRLRVAEVVEETAEARTLVFAVDGEHARRFGYRPGQFLTVRIPSDTTGSMARCYSLSSSPHTDDRLRVTVKRTGHGSSWICDEVRAGDELDCLPPAGVFTPASLDEDLLLLAAGSGITPVVSIVKSVLAAGTGSLTLVYANRDERSVIFAADLARLVERYPGRLTVLHWLESVQGLPSAATLTELARPYRGREAFVCGPKPFMDAARAALAGAGVPRRRVHLERFTSLGANPFEPAEDPPSEGGPCTLSVSLDGVRSTVEWPAGTRLLDLLLDNGLDAPYSCREGACSACACRLVSGEVTMLNNDVLEEEDVEEGIILACQSVPVTDAVEVSYE
ncbi:3-ketosteroid-9-alpha-hydroxylase [Actinophytocola xinjiangensis]|uniref:3-ketosteroid-9-alpha-hydroxylase n=1 Tax=Actinophytocola xinjiangensis TaxID=485602 RepID=A0A7Z1AZB0_9PSEU|nr:ferredoxin--NADP reductase [Actinophytocola xinjiangensis]OLF11730.1 3-ketosteroid-9-alpha-hydroxylase [Actinophytocola xinjiangensis]